MEIQTVQQYLLTEIVVVQHPEKGLEEGVRKEHVKNSVLESEDPWMKNWEQEEVVVVVLMLSL